MTQANDFTLNDENGRPVSLSQLLKAGPVMLVFYPGDFTPVCTKQLCDYRDEFAEFKEFGLQIVGISGNHAESHRKFREEHRFPFTLLTDPGGKVARQLGCTSKILFGMVSRGVFVIAGNGEIVFRHVEATPLTRRKSKELVPKLRELKAAGKI